MTATAKKTPRPSVGKSVVSKILQKAKAVSSSASRTYHGKETGFTLANFCQWLFENNESERHSEATLLSVLLTEFGDNSEFNQMVVEKGGTTYLQSLRTRYNYGILSSTKHRKAPSVYSVPYGDDGKPVTTRGNVLKLSKYLAQATKRGFGVEYDAEKNTFTIAPDSLVNRDVVNALLKDESTKDCEVSFGKGKTKSKATPAKGGKKKSAKKAK